MRSFILSVEIWRAFFDVYLDRYEDSKPKPMKQVLVTLANSLCRWPSLEQAQVLRRDVLDTFLFWITCPDYTSRPKPALQGLDYFVSKGIFSVRDVVESLRRIAPTAESPPVEESTSQITEGGRAVASSSDPGFPARGLRAASENIIETFFSTLLAWISYTDVATSASHLISTFFKFLRMQSTEEINFYHSASKLPLWVSPLKAALEKNADILEALKHRVLPELFMMNSEDLRHFVKSLHIERYMSGSSPAEDHSEVLLLLSSLQVAQDLDLVRVTGMLMLVLRVGEVIAARLLIGVRSGRSQLQLE